MTSELIARRMAMKCDTKRCNKGEKCRHYTNCPYEHDPLASYLCFDKKGYDKMGETERAKLRAIAKVDTLEAITEKAKEMCGDSKALQGRLAQLAGVGLAEVKSITEGAYSDAVVDFISIVEAAGYKLVLTKVKEVKL